MCSWRHKGSGKDKQFMSKSINARRFSDDQVKWLETTFRTEARPELRLKQHLARELGLQPRQVAIWFQNKRARSKTKEIEKEYTVLKSSFDELVSEFDALRKENQALIVQLQRLRVMAGEGDGNENRTELPTTEKQRLMQEIDRQEVCAPRCSDLDKKDEYPVEEEEDANVMNMDLIAEGSLASTEGGCSYESCLFRNDFGSRWQWWDKF